MMRHNFITIIIISALFLNNILLFSTSCNAFAQKKISVVRLVGAGGTQSLPMSYVSSFPRWTIDAKTKSLIKDDQDETTTTTTTTTTTVETNGARSTSFQPRLDFFIRNGAPTHVMAGLKLRGIPVQTTDESSSSLSDYLTATQWTSFDACIEQNFRYVMYYGPGDGTDMRLFMDNKLQTHILEDLAVVMSNAPDDTIASGFHIVSFPLDDWKEFFMGEDSIVTCVATSEPDARKLMELDEMLLEMTASSILQVTLSSNNILSQQ